MLLNLTRSSRLLNGQQKVERLTSFALRQPEKRYKQLSACEQHEDPNVQIVLPHFPKSRNRAPRRSKRLRWAMEGETAAQRALRLPEVLDIMFTAVCDFFGTVKQRKAEPALAYAWRTTRLANSAWLEASGRVMLEHLLVSPGRIRGAFDIDAAKIIISRDGRGKLVKELTMAITGWNARISDNAIQPDVWSPLCSILVQGANVPRGFPSTNTLPWLS